MFHEENSIRKGIVLAGGTGSRLSPITLACSKQLLPIYDKPMIYYSLSTLMLAGIRNILIITTKDDINKFKDLLGDGSNLGISLTYKYQEKPEGIVQAFTIGEDFLGNSPVSLILGDNIFYGKGLGKILRESSESKESVIFSYQVSDPERYGVVSFSEDKKL